MKNKGLHLIYWLLALFMLFMSGNTIAYDFDKAYENYLDFHNKSYEGDENPPTPQTKEQFLTSEIENAKQNKEIADEMGFDGISEEENEILNELENLRDLNYGETSGEPGNSGGDEREEVDYGDITEKVEDGYTCTTDGGSYKCKKEEPKQEEQKEQPVDPETCQISDTPEGTACRIAKTEAEKKAQEEAAKKAKECPNGCCGIKLNTNFPIIGNCIETKSNEANPTNAFPYMVGALTKIIMSLIMVVCFILVIVAGIMRAGDKPKEGKELLKKVAITILLLGFSGVILRLINPNFFG